MKTDTDYCLLRPRVAVDATEAPKTLVVRITVRAPEKTTAAELAELVTQFVNDETACDAVECEVGELKPGATRSAASIVFCFCGHLSDTHWLQAGPCGISTCRCPGFRS